MESPWSGDTLRNQAYARLALKHSIALGEAPFASHLLYTQLGVLNDKNAQERALGIVLGLVWGLAAEATVVYIDNGISEGMQLGIQAAHEAGRPVIYRSLVGATI